MTAAAPDRPPLPPENVYGHAKKLRFILDTIDRKRGEVTDRPLRVLDFGCGSGVTVSQYLIGPGVDYVGVDIHPPSLDYARTHFATPQARFLDHLPADLSFDVIVYADVLEHLDDPAAFLAAHHRQLAPGGVMVASVPNGYGGFEIERAIDRTLHLTPILRGLWRAGKRLLGRPVAEEPAVPFNLESGHVVFFTRRSLDRTMAAAGLHITRFAHGTLMGADLSSLAIRGPLLRANAWAADRLPTWAVSTWHFEIARDEDG